MLKKIGIASLVLSSSLFAGSYIGADIGFAKNDTTTSISGIASGDDSVSNDYTDISLIFGTGDNGGVKIQGRLNFESYDKQIFKDGDSFIEVGVDAIKEFSVNSNLYPYIKAGVGGDYMSVDGSYYNQSIVYGVELNAGVGVNVMTSDHLGLILGIDYKYRMWQDVDYGIVTVSRHDSGFEPYLGLRYSF